MKTAQFIDPYTLVTETIIAQLEKGVVPWHCPWRRDVGRPMNFHTGLDYRGINILLLGIRRFASPYWLTWNQLKQRGGSVKNGEHGSLVVKYGKFEKKTGEADEEGKEKTKGSAFLKGYKVFNAMQIEGICFPEVKPVVALGTPERIAKAESIVKGMPSPPVIREGRYTQACYRRATDTIDMPAMKSFESAETYFLTLYHELTHSTGSPSRLNRKTVVENDGFGSETYSQEELVAEMGAAFLGAEADIVRDNHEQSAAYLRGWLDALKDKDHRRWIVRAANQAAKATDFILGRLPTAKEVPDTEAAVI
ncbi:MAG: zincin-like metallopeptidase domain-containing protein [Verrucomicrobiota bacterium]